MFILKYLLWKFYMYRKGYPHKDHVCHIWRERELYREKNTEGTYLKVARHWGFDDSIYTIQDLAFYFTMSRERTKQLLCKFIRSHG